MTIRKGKKLCRFIKVELQVCAALFFLKNNLFPVAFSATVHFDFQLKNHCLQVNTKEQRVNEKCTVFFSE